MNRHVPLILLLCTALQACNARMVDEGGIGGTGMVAGTVTDVTSLNVNGERLDVSGAQFLRNDVPQLNLQDAVAVGEYVTLATGSGNQLALVSYRSPVTGPVQEGNGSDLIVLGRSVHVDDLAVLRGFRNVQDLSTAPAGSRVSLQGLATSARQGLALQVNGTPVKLSGTTLIDDGQVSAMLSRRHQRAA